MLGLTKGTFVLNSSTGWRVSPSADFTLSAQREWFSIGPTVNRRSDASFDVFSIEQPKETDFARAIWRTEFSQMWGISASDYTPDFSRSGVLLRQTIVGGAIKRLDPRAPDMRRVTGIAFDGTQLQRRMSRQAGALRAILVHARSTMERTPMTHLSKPT
jgi:hypothetical protein